MKYSKQHPNTTGGLGFNGQDVTEQSGYNAKYQHKAAGIPSAKENYGRGPTTGNKTGVSHPAAPGKTKMAATSFGNPDSINVGRGPRGGGTQVPSCSYDINVGRGPTKGNQ